LNLENSSFDDRPESYQRRDNPIMPANTAGFRSKLYEELGGSDQGNSMIMERREGQEGNSAQNF
jgi:hypothetical protein